MRCQRAKISISVCSSMCPMCSDPVTLGGGITIENTGLGAFGSTRNSCSRTQNSAHRGSICCGSYVLAIWRANRDPAPEHAYTVIAHVDTRAITLIFDYTRSNTAPSIHSKGACWVSLESQSWITSGLRTTRELSRGGGLKCPVQAPTATRGAPQKGASRYRRQGRRHRHRRHFHAPRSAPPDAVCPERERARTTDYKRCGTFFAVPFGAGAARRVGFV